MSEQNHEKHEMLGKKMPARILGAGNSKEPSQRAGPDVFLLQGATQFTLVQADPPEVIFSSERCRTQAQQ